MSKKLITEEIAEKTVNKWLDHKRVKETKREGLEAQIGSMVEAVMCGDLVLDEKTCVFTVNLAFGVGENEAITSLKISPRMPVKKVKGYLKGVKAGDGDGRVAAYVGAMTNQVSGVIGEIDTEDYGLLSAIAVFFF